MTRRALLPTSRRPGPAGVLAAASGLLLLSGIGSGALGQTSVTTYHNDTLRSGWNSSETALTAASVGSGQFALQRSVALDDQVDAQPLVAANQPIAGLGTYNVVYVATEGDTVYAIDGATGAILLSRNFGTPVPQSALPGQCGNNGPNIGINSTPVISVANNALYVVTDTYENNAPVFRLRSLNLSTLQDNLPPVVVAASHRLTDGSTYVFNPSVNRQRPGLLLSGGNVYAGFGSYCDIRADLSRGWLLGWNASSLLPLAGNQLNNQLATSPDSFYLSSIWMSGYGLATYQDGNPIFFVTGNTDFSGTTYNATTNIAESVVRILPDLSKVAGHFTPANKNYLDQSDNDFGSGGAMLLPRNSSQHPRLVVAAGKVGQLYLLDSANLKVGALGTYNIGNCWCGPSYFTGSDGIGRVVTSGGSSVQTWLLNASSNAPPSLSPERQTSITSGQDGGFLTSISSDGQQAGSAVIWAVSRPTDSNPANITLNAIDPASGHSIFSGVAGTWPNTGGNANIVPTIANGHVYVASHAELAIFGLGAPASPAALAAIQAHRDTARAASENTLVLQPGQHAFYGRIVAGQGSVLTIEKRRGERVRVDIAAARRSSELAVPVVGNAVLVVARYGSGGVMTADQMQRAKRSPAYWQPDR